MRVTLGAQLNNMADASEQAEESKMEEAFSVVQSDIAPTESHSVKISFSQKSTVNFYTIEQEESTGLEEIEDEDPFETMVMEGLSQLGRSADGTMQIFLSLSLQHRSLTSIDELVKYNHLQVLDLSYNELSDLSSLSNLPYLISLDASHNELTDVLNFKPPFSLREVNLSWNKIEKLTDLNMHKCLNKLIMDNNMIKQITGLEQCQRLRTLSLSENKIEKISGLEKLPLTYLDLSKNRIKRIENIASLKCLQTIDLSNNFIRSLKGLQSHDLLESVKLANNEIIDLSEARYIRDLVLLRSLDLSSNPIQDFPDYRLSLLFRIPALIDLDGTVVSPEEKVKAQNLFKPSRELIASRDHMMNLLRSYQQPIRLENSTLSSVETPYPMLILTGPSGCSKRMLTKRLCQEFPNYFGQGISYTTRGLRENEKIPRESEIDGVDYHFVTRDQFEKDAFSGKFIETCSLYNNQYGISRDTIENIAKEGLACVFHMELEGVMVLKHTHFEPRYVLILPETRKAHEERVRLSKFYSDAHIHQALDRVSLYEDMNRDHPGYFDMTICCDDIEKSYRLLKKVVLEYLGLTPVNSTASNLSMTTADSTLSDLSSIGVTQSASTAFEKDISTSGSPLKPWRQVRVPSRGMGSSRASRLTESTKSPVEAASIQRRFKRVQAATVGIVSTSEEQLSKVRLPLSATGVPHSWGYEELAAPSATKRASSAPNGLNSSNVPTEYDYEADVKSGESESETESETSDMSSAHAGYHMVDDDDDDDEQLSLTSSQASSSHAV